MKNLIRFLVLMISLLMLGCHFNTPLENDRQGGDGIQRLIANEPSASGPAEIEALISGSFLTWWQATMASEPAMGLAVTSDTYTCSWGNFGMADLSDEPRTAFQNEPSYGNIEHIEVPWSGNYAAIFEANDGIRAILSGTVSLGADSARAVGFGKLVQGLAHGYIALFFDQGFVFDDTTDFRATTLTLVPYTAVMTAAIQQLQDAIEIFDANTFTIPNSWINGQTYTNVELAEIAHSFIARYMVSVARDRTERQNVDWNTVITHLDQGITQDFGVSGDGGGRSDPWFSATHWYSSQWNTWQRADYQLIGPSDRSTGYDDWLALDPEDRDEFIMDTGDLRIWDQTYAPDSTQNPGTQFEQIGPSGYPGGTYHRSRYGHDVFVNYTATSAGSPATTFRLQEIDFMRAEALLQLGGDPAQIAALLDMTHVVNGGYPSAAGLPVGSITDSLNPQQINGATLWSVLKYEKLIELLGTWSGLQFWDRRGWGDLTSLTPIHFPVPAKELLFLLILPYTFGGGGVGSAP